jgi:hypothetical protein
MLGYYVPGWQSATLERLESVGLGHAFERSPVVGISPRGPDGGAGVILTAEAARRPEWDWQAAPGKDWWIGLGGETTPAYLARKEQIAGHEVELGDGRKWLVPVARTFGIGSRLPQRLILGPDGESWEGRPLERFAAVSAKAERVERVMLGDLGDDEEPMRILGEGAAIAVEALALNYRIGMVEASFLGLLTEPIVHKILWAFIDGPTLEDVFEAREEAAKERAPLDTPDGSSSCDGAAA